jgi:hypothetical protein
MGENVAARRPGPSRALSPPGARGVDNFERNHHILKRFVMNFITSRLGKS